MTTSMSMRVPVVLRQRANRQGSRRGPSSTSLFKWPSGIPSGRAFSEASTPALGGTLNFAGGDGMAVMLGAIDDRGLPPERPRVACVSAGGSTRAGKPGSAELEVGAVGVAAGGDTGKHGEAGTGAGGAIRGGSARGGGVSRFSETGCAT